MVFGKQFGGSGMALVRQFDRAAVEGEAGDLGGTANAQGKPASHAGGDVEIAVAAAVEPARVAERQAAQADRTLAAATVRKHKLTAMGVTGKSQIDAALARLVEGVGMVGQQQGQIAVALGVDSPADQTRQLRRSMGKIDSRYPQPHALMVKHQGFVDQQLKFGLAEASDQLGAVVEVIVIAQHHVDAQRSGHLPQRVDDIVEHAQRQIDKIARDRDQIAPGTMDRLDDVRQAVGRGEPADVEIGEVRDFEPIERIGKIGEHEAPAGEARSAVGMKSRQTAAAQPERRGREGGMTDARSHLMGRQAGSRLSGVFARFGLAERDSGLLTASVAAQCSRPLLRWQA